MKIPPGALKTLPPSPAWTPVKVSSMHFTSTDKTETYHSASFWGIICGCCSGAKSCLILCDPMDCSMLGFPDHHYLLELAQTLSVESVMFSNHLILCCSLLLLSSIFPSIGAFSNVSALHIRWPKYWSFSFSPSNEYSELISFTIDWFDLSAVQGTLKSLLQHHSSKASILWHSAFITVQLSHLYMTTGKPIALTIRMLIFF